MQKLHEEDLAGRILNGPGGGEYTVVCLPMEYDETRKCVTRWGEDPRTEPGQLLCPARFDAASVIETKTEMGSRTAAAQLQQLPAPAEGNLLKREWFSERWTVLPADILLVQSWDCSFKDNSTADYVAGHIWGYSKGKFYLVDRIHDRMGLPETCACILSWCKRWPKAYGKLIEDKANGPAVEQVLRDKVSGMIMIEPEGGKVARVNAVAPLCEARNVVLPDESVHPWAGEVLSELTSFPFARHDDDVDAMTQAILHLHGRSPTKYLHAMEQIRQNKIPSYFRQT